MTVFYHAFFGPNTPGLEGQQNLSREVRKLLGTTFDAQDLAPVGSEPVAVPSVFRVIVAMYRLLLTRALRPGCSGNLTVIDMVHSLATLDPARARDRLVVIGHDSYALRTWRDFRAARGGLPRLRLALSWACWRHVEFLLRLLAWRAMFVSPLDSHHASWSKAGETLAIPVAASLREAGRRRRMNAGAARKPGRPRLLVSLPVCNTNQQRIDRLLVDRLLEIASARACITLWGKGAAALYGECVLPDNVRVVDWADDYARFLQGFDLLVYPRMIGSGFHTKLAEAQTLGVECICVDWVAEPLLRAGYDGILTFSDPSSFSRAVEDWLESFFINPTRPLCSIPAKATPEAALAPLLDAVTLGLEKETACHDE